MILIDIGDVVWVVMCNVHFLVSILGWLGEGTLDLVLLYFLQNCMH